MAEYLVKQATLEQEHDFGDSKMNRFELVLEGSDGTVQAQHWLRTDKSPPLEGDRVETELVQARGRDAGLKTKGLRVLGADQPASSAPSGGGREKASPAANRDRSIERQVALKAAAEVSAAAIAAGAKVPAEKVTELAETFAGFITPAPSVPEGTDARQTQLSDDDNIPF